MTAEQFRVRGVMSQRAACLAIFTPMEPGDWISNADLAHRMGELTETEIDEAAAISAAYGARETLMSQGEIGFDRYLGGYRRMRAENQVAGVEGRFRKTRKAAKRLVRDAVAGLNNPEITGAERHRMEERRRVTLAQAQLDERRALKRRPD